MKKLVPLTLALAASASLVAAGAKSPEPPAAATSAAAGPALEEELVRAFREQSQGAVWRSPSVGERDALREAMRLLFAAENPCQEATLQAARPLATAAGFELVPSPTTEPALLYVRELQANRRGGGLYVLRCGPALPLVVQAPHSFYDTGTGDLARKVFLEGRARAAFWNTVHRYKSEPGERREDRVHPADVAHEPGNLFQAATIGAAAGLRTLRVAQLHGFSERQSIPFDVVLSSGEASRKALPVKTRLAPLGVIALHGVDTEELGATTNVQGRALNQSLPGQFLHLELSAQARKVLREDASARRRLIDALEGSWWE